MKIREGLLRILWKLCYVTNEPQRTLRCSLSLLHKKHFRFIKGFVRGDCYWHGIVLAQQQRCKPTKCC